MEKFCIVKRRKKNSDVVDTEAITVKERTSLFSTFFGANNKNGQSTENSCENRKDIINFSLTPQQCNIVKSSNHFKALLNGTARGYNLTIDRHDSDQIVFNMNFEEIENVRLLKPKQVCKMLQISKYLLRKLAKQNKITSFKIGCLRRFTLKDVLNFISESKDVCKNNSVVI